MIMETQSVTPDAYGILYRDGILYRIWNVCKRCSCSLVGHRHDLELGSKRLALKCERCGWTSPGWTFGPQAAAREESATYVVQPMLRIR
jgi:hypothetical protein